MRKTSKPAKSGSSTASERRRQKCACASCTCTVDMDRAVRRGNLLFCGQACANSVCSVEQCSCEHDHCAA